MAAVSFRRTFLGELIKSRHTYAYVLTFSVAVLVVGLTASITSGTHKNGTNDIWPVYSKFLFSAGATFYVAYTLLITWLINNVEHRVQGFKALFALPVSRLSLYFSKVLLLLIWHIGSLVVLYVLTWLGGEFLAWAYPSASFSFNHAQLLLFLWRILIASMSLISIQFFLSIYFKNYLVALGAGSFMIIVGFILSIPETGYKYPYAYSFYLLHDIHDSFFTPGVIWNIGYSIIFFTVGYLVMSRKNIKE